MGSGELMDYQDAEDDDTGLIPLLGVQDNEDEGLWGWISSLW
jgi:hypothetical protein